MSVPLPQTDMSKVSVGKTVNVDIIRVMQTIPISQLIGGKVPHITLNNRSGFGLVVTLTQSGKTFNLPPNSHTNLIDIVPSESTIQVFVNYGAAYGPINGNLLLGDLYLPSEDVHIVSGGSVDMLSQPRVITVPIVTASHFTGDFNTVAVNSNYSLDTRFRMSNYPNLIANDTANIYLYYLSVQCNAGGWAFYEIRWYNVDNAFNPQGIGVTLWSGIVDSSGTIANRSEVFSSTIPIRDSISGFTSAPYIQPFFICTSAQNPGTSNFRINLLTDFDTINYGHPGSIGNITQPQFVVNPGTF